MSIKGFLTLTAKSKEDYLVMTSTAEIQQKQNSNRTYWASLGPRRFTSFMKDGYLGHSEDIEQYDKFRIFTSGLFLV